MPVTFMGLKPGVGPVLKVMANNADDPLTTPNSDVEKFLFNSEDRDYAYIRRIIRVEHNDPGWSANFFTIENNIAQTEAEALASSSYYDIVFVDTNGWQYEKGWYKYQNSPARYRSRFALYAQHLVNPSVPPGYYFKLQISDFTNIRAIGGHFLVIEWELPAGTWTRPRLPAPQTLPGQRVLEISSTRCALAAPGFDVQTATAAQMIFSNTKRVIGCIASGELTLVGTTGSVSIPTIPGTGYFVDLQWNESGQDRRVPYFRDGSADINVRCRINGSSLEFISVAADVTITYHVYAFGHGTTDITSPLRLATTTQGVMIWRGPSGGPVAFRDIIFDSRIRYPRVVSDQLFNSQEPTSYWGPSSFSFPSRGYRPIIKSAAFGLRAFNALTMTRTLITPFYDTVGTGVGYAATVTPTSVSFGTPSTPDGVSLLSRLASPGFIDEFRGRGVRMYALSI